MMVLFSHSLPNKAFVLIMVSKDGKKSSNNVMQPNTYFITNDLWHTTTVLGRGGHDMKNKIQFEA